MGRRRTFQTSELLEIVQDQHWNNRLHGEIHSESSSFMVPVESAAVSGLGSTAYTNIILRTDDQPLSASNTSDHRSSNLTTVIDHRLYPSTTSSTSQQLPQTYYQRGPSGYPHVSNAQMSSIYSPQIERARLPLKRKGPVIYSGLASGSSNGFYAGESSSNYPIPSDRIQPKRLVDFQSMPYYSFVEEGSLRNVRRRHDQVHAVQVNPLRSHAPNNLPSNVHSATLPVSNMAGSSNFESLHNRIILPCRHSGHEINQSIASASGSIDINIAELDNGFPPDHMNPSIQVSTRGLPIDHTSFGLRMSSYRNTSNFASVTSTRPLEDHRLPEHENASSSRHLRPVSSHRNTRRNIAVRNFHNRYHSITDEHYGHSRVVSQGSLITGRSTYFDSRNIFDEHQDMRLDVDNLSYEELLALGERIGVVSTGLSEDNLSKHLVETIYCSPDQIQDESEEPRCAICLEEYKDRESLGRLDCQHDFHFSCIKKWLEMKNVCPICKTSFPADKQ